MAEEAVDPRVFCRSQSLWSHIAQTMTPKVHAALRLRLKSFLSQRIHISETFG